MAKKLFFYTFMLAFTVAILELCALLVIQLVDRDDFFDHREFVLQRLDEAGLAEWAAHASDPVLGWRSFGPRVQVAEDCWGQQVEYSYDAKGARTYSGYDAVAAEIIVVGDSYTHGDEVNDDVVYPARLAELLGVSVANHGVGGYGPTQGVLNFSENVSAYPRAKVVVLAIMYENLFRMVNSYRPVLNSTGSDYTLKPYMAAGEVVAHPGAEPYTSLENFLVAANRAFDMDFWAKPQVEFPYMISLVKSLHTDYFAYRRLQKLLRYLEMPEFAMIFENPEVQLNLVSLLNQFALVAKQAGLKPMAIFIPRNSMDIDSGGTFVEENRARIDSDLLLGDVGQYPDVDWLQFNLRELEGNNICHPSSYGYQVIADYISGFIQANGFRPGK
jgi:hypothetical protein